MQPVVNMGARTTGRYTQHPLSYGTLSLLLSKDVFLLQAKIMDVHFGVDGMPLKQHRPCLCMKLWMPCLEPA
jgi:hypothetical protein